MDICIHINEDISVYNDDYYKKVLDEIKSES